MVARDAPGECFGLSPNRTGSTRVIKGLAMSLGLPPLRIKIRCPCPLLGVDRPQINFAARWIKDELYVIGAVKNDKSPVASDVSARLGRVQHPPHIIFKILGISDINACLLEFIRSVSGTTPKIIPPSLNVLGESVATGYILQKIVKSYGHPALTPLGGSIQIVSRYLPQVFNHIRGDVIFDFISTHTKTVGPGVGQSREPQKLLRG